MAERSALEPEPRSGPRRFSYRELVAEMPETSQPCELWEGELVMSPAPSFYHQEVVLRFYRHLYDWVARHKLGKVIAAPIDMVLSEHRVVQPDLAFIAAARLGIIQRAIMGPADLVVEVVSLGDRIEKRDLYEQYGIQEYWIVDPESRSADVLVLERGAYRLAMRCNSEQVAASQLLSGFSVPLGLLLHGE